MPLQKLQFRPGVNKESTTLANEGGWFYSDKIRFRSGFPEKIGGWQNDTGTVSSTLKPSTGVFWGVCRSMWNWITLSGYNLLSLGTNLKYYIQNGSGGLIYDVTPLRNPSGTAVASNAFTTTAYTIPSSPAGYVTVVCNVSGHGAQTNDFVTLSSVGGSVNGIPAASLTGEFQITYVNSNQFSIQVYVTSSVTAGTTGSATFTFQINTGNSIFTKNVGWGAGTWGGILTGAQTTTLATALNSTTVSSFVSASATTINVASASAFAASGSIYIGNELITYSGKTGTSFTGCTRATGGTTASAYFTGMPVAENVTSIVLTSASGFSSVGTNYIIIDSGTSISEIISYTGITTNTLTGCVRGALGSHVYGHAAGVTVVQSNSYTGWGSPAPITQALGQQLRLWSQSNYGQNLIMNPRGGPLYLWSVNAGSPSTFSPATVISAASTGDTTCPSLVNYVLVSDASRFTIAFGANDPSGVLFPATLNPMLIRWSDQDTAASPGYNTWYPRVTNQAGDYLLSHGSQIITAIQTRQEILVLTDAAIYSMQYLGPPYVWGFQIMGDNISVMSPQSVVTVNNVTYWMGADKFYMYSGRVETLPCTLRQYIYNNINQDQSYQVVSGTNEGYNEIWWMYCSISGTNPDGSDGTGTPGSPNQVIDRYVIYNHLERTWYYGTFNGIGGTVNGVAYSTVRPRTAWLDSPLRAEPTASITYISGNAYTNGAIVYHETGVDNNETGTAAPIDSYVQSSDFDIGDGHNFGFVWRLIPDVTFDGSNAGQPKLNFTVLPRNNPGSTYGSSDNPAVTSLQNYSSSTTYAVQQFTQQVYVRIRGRQMAFRVDSNGQLGVQWQLGTPRIDVRPDGRR